MGKQWIVYDKEEGLRGIFTDYEKALEEYEQAKDAYQDYVYRNQEHDDEEMIILAVIEKQFYSYETNNSVEYGRKTMYWDFKEVAHE